MLSEAKLDELWDELKSYAIAESPVRSDITALLLYRDGFGTVEPMYLFWELYRPIYHDETIFSAKNNLIP